MTVRGKVVAITGASSGIGRATAICLAQQGASVMLGARRQDKLVRVAEQIATDGGTAGIAQVDVSARKDVERFVSATVERFGRLDVIVNNAGIGPLSRFDGLCIDDWDAMIDVNLRGTLYGIAAALPVFQHQGSGHVVNIVSTAGLRIAPTMGVYAATKNAVRTASEALRQESTGIRVTEVSPGFVATDFSSSIADEKLRGDIEDNMAKIAILPEAIANAVAYAIGQPDEVEIGSIVVRPTAQT
jgi:NADP-dependent 3-hydroxy acid dehydrogenase YdfG